MTETHKPKHPLDMNEFIRGWNDVLCLWRLCRYGGTCFKTRACQARDARRCFHTHIVLLPSGVEAFMHAIRDAHEQGLSYDEAIESMEDTEAEGALEDWHEAVRYSETLRKARNVTWPDRGWQESVIPGSSPRASDASSVAVPAKAESQ